MNDNRAIKALQHQKTEFRNTRAQSSQDRSVVENEVQILPVRVKSSFSLLHPSLLLLSMPVVLSVNSPTLTEQELWCMSQSESYKPYIELAVDVFKAQDQESINFLKDFLTVLPSPTYIEQVLIAGIEILAETEPESCRWLLRNGSFLMPEVDLVDLAIDLAITKLESQGFLLGQDFALEANGQLLVSEQAKVILLMDNSVRDRLLIEEIVLVGCELSKPWLTETT